MPKSYDNPEYPYRRSPDQDAHERVHHPVIIVGGGPAGLSAAIDLALHDIPVVLLDDNNTVSVGSRAICFSKRTLEDSAYLHETFQLWNKVPIIS